MKKYYFSFFFLFLSLSLFSQQNAQYIEELDRRLVEIKYLDQIGRNNISEIATASMENPELKNQLDSAIVAQTEIDTSNQQFVSNLLDANGWPSGLSFDANMGIFYVIQHADINFMNKYAKSVKKAYENNNLSANVYAVFEDQIRMYNGKPQLYGSQTISINGVYYVWPVEDAENVDRRRAEMNLPAIDTYLEPLRNMVKVNWDKKMTVNQMRQIEGYNLR